ncbi:hypothetical protein HK103_003359 [Boothiomyces macroporosus]|uniref:Uncharacterized protein n=1 Tax=Boothiomyces macroporosus TaxID=261099 RepID=A0AAD5UI44_9FUNG|nr:hypothetical protein HK103_003359 [Boothiomyces macroporosus]
MVAQAIPKPYTETATPRPQRRHYFDKFARDLEVKIITSDFQAKTSKSTYGEDFVPIDKQHIKVLDQRVKKFNISVTPPKIKNADELLYLSTYQVGYDKKSMNTSKIHYFDELPTKRQSNSSPQSLYQASFDSQPHADMSKINNPGREHAMTKLLYQVTAPNLTARDLFHAGGKLKNGTAYKFDYQNTNRFIPSIPAERPKPVFIHTNRAIKYRKWAEQ